LFQKYGPLVRFGPNSTILNDVVHFAEYFTYNKLTWVEAFRARLDSFDHGGVADIKDHAKFKKQIMGAYSMSHILKSEEKVDGHVSELMGKLQSGCGKVFDLAPWIQFVAFDVAMDVTFSRPLGFVKTGSDVKGLIRALHTLNPLAGTLAIFPGVVAFIQQPRLFATVAPNQTNKLVEKTGPAALYRLAWSQVM
jgi:hypothetical protein